MSSSSTLIDLTVGEIARRLGEPLHKIEYVIRARRIAPARIAGNIRIFADSDVVSITDALAGIAARRRLPSPSEP
jgi:hypothetical protein